jgi:hypothetical protein
LSNVDNSSDELANLTFKHFVTLKDQVNETQRKLESLGLRLPAELADFNRALTDCTSDRHVDKALRRVKANLPVLGEGYPRLREVREALSEDTEKALRNLRSAIDHLASQLAEVDELAAVQAHRNEIQAHLAGANPWRGYADAAPAADQLRAHYQSVRGALLGRQQAALDSALDSIKRRDEFAELDQDQQHVVLESIRKHCQHSSSEALQPTLLVLEQAPQRLMEASARAQKQVDTFLNEKGPGSSPEPLRIHTVRLDLKNKVIANEAELDLHLAALREKCLKELRQGVRVRFEE